MLKRIYIMWLIMAGGVLYSASLTAQNNSDWTDFGYIKSSDAWLESENAAGLDNLKINKISLAEVFANKSKGEFINYYQSNNSYSFGAQTESFFRLNDKVVFYGKMNYSNFFGKNMGGSTLIDPYYNSFDIVEYADSTAGNKKMETYHLTGALSTYLWHGILMGLKANYQTISYFKTRDLRHTNDLMDMTVTAGLRYQFKKIADVGLNYYFRKTTENTSYQSMGNTDQQFNSLISFGSFFGRQERFGDYGYTGSYNNNPFFNKFNGVSVQVDILPENDLHFFNELGLKWRKGYFGERSSVEIMYTENVSDIYYYKGLISLLKNQSLHQIEIKLEQESLTNYEKAYRKETSAAGNTTIEYYGKSEVLDRTVLDASIVYTGNFQVTDNNPRWVLCAAAYFSQKDQITTIYPFYRKQTIYQMIVDASVKRNILRQDNMYSFYAGGTFGSGGGIEKEDGQYASSSQGSGRSLDRYLYREYEYLTASRGAGNAGFRYTRLLPQKLRIYGDIKYSFTKAFSVNNIGDTYSNIAISLGFIF